MVEEPDVTVTSEGGGCSGRDARLEW
jgi:hypothetical protein